jgi:hypothetical protein
MSEDKETVGDKFGLQPIRRQHIEPVNEALTIQHVVSLPSTVQRLGQHCQALPLAPLTHAALSGVCTTDAGTHVVPLPSHAADASSYTAKLSANVPTAVYVQNRVPVNPTATTPGGKYEMKAACLHNHDDPIIYVHGVSQSQDMPAVGVIHPHEPLNLTFNTHPVATDAQVDRARFLSSATDVLEMNAALVPTGATASKAANKQMIKLPLTHPISQYLSAQVAEDHPKLTVKDDNLVFPMKTAKSMQAKLQNTYAAANLHDKECGTSLVFVPLTPKPYSPKTGKGQPSKLGDHALVVTPAITGTISATLTPESSGDARLASEFVETDEGFKHAPNPIFLNKTGDASSVRIHAAPHLNPRNYGPNLVHLNGQSLGVTVSKQTMQTHAGIESDGEGDDDRDADAASSSDED